MLTAIVISFGMTAVIVIMALAAYLSSGDDRVDRDRAAGGERAAVSHWIIVPIVLPAMLAAVLVLVMRHHLMLQRTFSIAGIAGAARDRGGTGVAGRGRDDHVYELGDWPAPFGIVLVADRLSTLMLLLTALLAFAVMLYSIGSGGTGADGTSTRCSSSSSWASTAPS